MVTIRRSTAANKPTKLGAPWEGSIWLGHADESDEVYVGTADGAYKARARNKKAISRMMGRRTT